MRRVALVAALLLSAPAYAAFIQSDCIDVSARRFDQADIVGVGTITDIDCQCAGRELRCEKTLRLNDVTKGYDVPQTVHIHETIPLDFRTTPVYCQGTHTDARNQVGTKEIYFLKDTKAGLIALPAVKCMAP